MLREPPPVSSLYLLGLWSHCTLWNTPAGCWSRRWWWRGATCALARSPGTSNWRQWPSSTRSFTFRSFWRLALLHNRPLPTPPRPCRSVTFAAWSASVRHSATSSDHCASICLCTNSTDRGVSIAIRLTIADYNEHFIGNSFIRP